VPQDSIWSSTASAGELGVASHWAEDGRPPWDGRGPGLVLGARRTNNASAVIESESQLPRDRGRLRHAAVKDVKNRSGAQRICFDIDPMHDSRGVNELQLTVCVYVRGWTASRPEIEDEPHGEPHPDLVDLETDKWRQDHLGKDTVPGCQGIEDVPRLTQREVDRSSSGDLAGPSGRTPLSRLFALSPTGVDRGHDDGAHAEEEGEQRQRC